MSDVASDKKIFSLQEVTASIQHTLSARYKSSFWVKAEMNKLNHYPHSGHCYPDLVEKQDGKVVAQMKSTLWRDDYLRINRNFLDLVKSPLKDGIRMLFCAKITFDAQHGLALRILDIDPVFSLGELEREKQESISRLTKEAIFNSNKSVAFPLLPKRLAVISVQTSKGYADFVKVIGENPWGYRFFHVLFPSLLQGDRAVESIRYQLQRIRKIAANFDVVAIIRGGGGEVGLSCFNDYQLSRDIALFPIPVITGIGHATNETVVEMVSYRNAITPTELADYLLQKFHNFSVPVQKAKEILTAKSRSILADQRQDLQQTVRYFRSLTDNVLIRCQHDVRQQARDLFRQSNVELSRRKQEHTSVVHALRGFSLSFCRSRRQELKQQGFVLRKDVATCLKNENTRMVSITRTVANMHPENVLKRGYSITRVHGKAITSIRHVKEADILQTILADGIVVSKVKTITKSPEE